MKNNNELNYFNETRKQELDKMIADFSDEGCMFVEDMFTEFNACFRRGYDRSNGRMTVSFGDEFGNDLTFILSREEIEYVTARVPKSSIISSVTASLPMRRTMPKKAQSDLLR